MLEYTGHPLVDVGVATITAFAGKWDPTRLAEADLDKVVDYIIREYIRQPLKSFLTVAFTSNAWFNQDAYNPDKPGLSVEEREKRRQKRERWARHHLRQWSSEGEEAGTEQDVFTGEPSISVELSGKLLPGRAARAQVPLAMGDDYINFYTNGVLVYDGSHSVMQNGSGLLGDESSTQSSIIVPNPQSDSLYYIFTVGENGGNGLRYSEVDMSLNGGLGGIIASTKNTQLYDENNMSMSVTEKITSVKNIKNTVLLQTSDYSKTEAIPAMISLRMLQEEPNVSEYAGPSQPIAVLLEVRLILS